MDHGHGTPTTSATGAASATAATTPLTTSSMARATKVPGVHAIDARHTLRGQPLTQGADATVVRRLVRVVRDDDTPQVDPERHHGQLQATLPGQGSGHLVVDLVLLLLNVDDLPGVKPLLHPCDMDNLAGCCYIKVVQQLLWKCQIAHS